MELTLKVLDQELSVCKVDEVSSEVYETQLYFIGRTDEELSLVCETRVAPAESIAREDGWRAFRVEGVLDFSLTGILAKLSAVLADAGVGIFAVSTYNTDYILVKERDMPHALDSLHSAGYEIA